MGQLGSLILLPTFNERENLPLVLPRIHALEGVDVLVIDDSSPDGTGDIAEELRGKYPRLSVLHRRNREGLGRAYVSGFREAIKRGYSQEVVTDSHHFREVLGLRDGRRRQGIVIQ